MASRALLACLAIAFAFAKPEADVALVEVSASDELEDVERRYTPELAKELRTARDDVLLLYTEYSSRSSRELKNFMRNMRTFSNETTNEIDGLDTGPESCRSLLHHQLKKIQYDAHRAAHFSAETHHKFLLGHVVVFRMHLNKSEDYIKKCDRATRSCGPACEVTPRVTRWRRLALDELHRVREDLEHSRKQYRDILIHARRRLNHLRRAADTKAREVADEYRNCIQG